MVDGDVLVNIFFNQLMVQFTKVAFFTLNFLNVKSSEYLVAKYIPKNGESFLFLNLSLIYFSKETQPLHSLFSYPLYLEYKQLKPLCFPRAWVQK